MRKAFDVGRNLVPRRRQWRENEPGDRTVARVDRADPRLVGVFGVFADLFELFGDLDEGRVQVGADLELHRDTPGAVTRCAPELDHTGNTLQLLLLAIDDLLLDFLRAGTRPAGIDGDGRFRDFGGELNGDLKQGDQAEQGDEDDADSDLDRITDRKVGDLHAHLPAWRWRLETTATTVVAGSCRWVYRWRCRRRRPFGRFHQRGAWTCCGLVARQVGKDPHLLGRPQTLIAFDDELISRGERRVDLDRIAVTVPLADRNRLNTKVFPDAEDHRMATRPYDRVLADQQRRMRSPLKNDLGQHALLQLRQAVIVVGVLDPYFDRVTVAAGLPLGLRNEVLDGPAKWRAVQGLEKYDRPVGQAGSSR